MVTVSKGNDAAEQKIAELERELIGTQEMLAFVLSAIGDPVEVTKESINQGLPAGSVIAVDDDLEREVFVFSLTKGEE